MMAFDTQWLRNLSVFPLLVGMVVFLAARRWVFGRQKGRASNPTELSHTKTAPHPHVLQFPPSRRHSMASLPGLEKQAKSLVEVSPEVLKAKALPTGNSRPDYSRDDQYTPTGFSTQDVAALGRFPDYAVLSGVPHPEPVAEGWDINKAVFRPFRPFRWAYHQHMALMKFEPNWWVELEQNYFIRMKERHALLAQYGEEIMFHGPASDLACRELMEMVFQFVTRRYPAHFSLEKDNTVLVNRLLGTRTDLTTTQPLQALFDNIPEDYVVMLRDPADGNYYARAGAVCSSVGWNIGQHRNKPLRRIHDHVPDYAERMAMSMDRYFSRMPTDAPIQRGSWGLEDWDLLFSGPVTTPAGKQWERSAFAGRPQDLTADRLRLRCDWQTLRRLPISGAIVFNFKAIFDPLAIMRDEPYVPALLLTVLQAGKESLITYKCEDHVRTKAIEALRAWAAEQVRDGLVPEGWEPKTLDESPFFPGWEERWRARQGL